MLKDARFSAEEELKAFRLKEEERFKVEVEQVRASQDSQVAYPQAGGAVQNEPLAHPRASPRRPFSPNRVKQACAMRARSVWVRMIPLQRS